MINSTFCFSLTKGTLLTDHLLFIHQIYLCKICAESGFKGLSYCGGPEVTCKTFNKPTILPCIKYNREEDLSQKAVLQPPCRLCQRTECSTQSTESLKGT